MSIERIFKKLGDLVKTINPLRKMKLIPKLASTYIITVVLCTSIVVGFYYVRMTKNIQNQTADLIWNTVIQAKESIEYKVELYNTLAEYIYLNQNLQDLLFREYYEPFERAEATGNIISNILPLSQGYKDIKKISLFIVNSTINCNDDNIKDIESAEDKIWHLNLSKNDDNILWLHYVFQDIPYQKWKSWNGQSLESMIEDSSVEMNPGVQLSLFKNLRHGLSGTYLGILKIDLDMDGIFSSIHIKEDDSEEWFDILDTNGELFYSSLDQKNGIYPQVSSDIRNMYINFLKSSDQSMTLNIEKRNYLLLKNTIEPTGWILISINPLEKYQRDLDELRSATYFLMVLCLGVFILLSWFMASGFSKRIRTLSRSMKQIEDGNFDIDVFSKGYDEIDSLAGGMKKMANRLKFLIDEVYAIKVREKEAELKALQSQINPHFLYNTLASISWLGIQSGAEEITKMSNALAKFYRISLSGGKNVISIQDEIQHVKAYTEIQRMRFKNRIKMVYQVDPIVLNGEVPKLILQPFVENAIIHGMSPYKKDITIQVKIQFENNLVVWKVIDDGVGIPRDRLERMLDMREDEMKGYGARNVNQKIKVYFGEQYGIRIISRLGIGTCVVITTPLKQQGIQEST